MVETADRWFEYDDEVDRQLDELKLDFTSQVRRGRAGTVRAQNYFNCCFKDGLLDELKLDTTVDFKYLGCFRTTKL